jgi:hypothetical protein
VQYTVFGMTEENFLQLFSSLPLAASPAAESFVERPLEVLPVVEDVAPPPQEESPIPVPEPEIGSAELTWFCEICTLENLPHVNECAACTSLRPSGTGAAATSGPSTEAGWWCSMCTFINPIAETM